MDPIGHAPQGGSNALTPSTSPKVVSSTTHPQDQEALQRAWQTARILIYQQRWLLIVSLICGPLLAASIMALSPPQYRARARLVLERRAPRVLSQVVDVYDLGSESIFADKAFRSTQLDIARSKPVRDRTAKLLGLNIQAIEKSLHALISSQGTPDLELRQKLRWLGLNPDAPPQGHLPALKKIIPALAIASQVKILPVLNTDLLNIIAQTKSPKGAAKMANAYAKAYMQHNLAQKAGVSSMALSWLKEQAVVRKAKLHKAEEDLRTFNKDATWMGGSFEKSQEIYAQNVAQHAQALRKLEQETMEKKELLHRLNQAQKDFSTRNITAILPQMPLLDALQKQIQTLMQEQAEYASTYTPSHPKMIAIDRNLHKTQKLLGKAVASSRLAIQKELLSMATIKNKLQEKIEMLNQKASSAVNQNVTLTRLMRERDAAEETFRMLQKRQEETELTSILRVNNVHLFESAEAPTRPATPRLLRILPISCLMCLFLGTVIALVRELRGGALHTAEDMQTLAGIELLGVLPASSYNQAGDLDLATVEDPHSALAECCRGIRTQILFADPDRPMRSLVIASASPQEGKSTLSINLAATIALADQRVLLIDTDMRRPRLHRTFGISNEHGITSVLVGSQELDSVIQKSPVDNLHILPCGPIPPNPTEILHTEKFSTLVATLHQRYDLLIFDTPPAVPFADARVLSTMVDGVILVARAHQTSWRRVRQAKERFEQVGNRWLAGVLNGVNLERDMGHGYYESTYYQGLYYHDGPSDPDNTGKKTAAA